MIRFQELYLENTELIIESLKPQRVYKSSLISFMQESRSRETANIKAVL